MTAGTGALLALSAPLAAPFWSGVELCVSFVALAFAEDFGLGGGFAATFAFAAAFALGTCFSRPADAFALPLPLVLRRNDVARAGVLLKPNLR